MNLNYCLSETERRREGGTKEKKGQRKERARERKEVMEMIKNVRKKKRIISLVVVTKKSD